MIMRVLIAPDKELTRVAVPVEDIAGSQTLIDNMVETMVRRGGMGLAAPQVGISQRLIVIKHEEFGIDPIVLINPTINDVSEDVIDVEEGCLSLPELAAVISRPKDIAVSFTDRLGNDQKVIATGLLSRCIQHEMDHLHGKLILDHVSRLKKNIFIRKLVKFKKEHNLQ